MCFSIAFQLHHTVLVQRSELGYYGSLLVLGFSFKLVKPSPYIALSISTKLRAKIGHLKNWIEQRFLIVIGIVVFRYSN